VSADIFGAQPADEDRLAEIYDLEHDDLVADLPFYRELARHAAGPVLDLGCGSGRLFATLLEAGVPRLLGIDGSPALEWVQRATAERCSAAAWASNHAPSSPS